MPEPISIEPLKKTTKIKRSIAHIKGANKGATIVFFAGIHGNEPAGVNALKHCLANINTDDVNGSIYAISGNLKALNKATRFINEDLNRMWITSRIDLILKKRVRDAEEEELVELYSLIKDIIKHQEPPFYFIDIHTTSSPTLPFITINDALINRNFSKQFPVPIVLGIEEYLNGPLLSYLNSLGYASLGFEGGQHQTEEALDNCKAFVNLTLHHTNVYSNQEKVDASSALLKRNSNCNHTIYEVVHKQHLTHHDEFKMKPNFWSFQDVPKGTELAELNGEVLKAKQSITLFMPLYQSQGNDGFYFIKPIKPFYLKLSRWLRKHKVDRILPLLPGVYWLNKDKTALKVDLRIAKFLTKRIFHLFGYRNKVLSENYIAMYNRERVTKHDMYKNLKWNS